MNGKYRPPLMPNRAWMSACSMSSFLCGFTRNTASQEQQISRCFRSSCEMIQYKDTVRTRSTSRIQA